MKTLMIIMALCGSILMQVANVKAIEPGFVHGSSNVLALLGCTNSAPIMTGFFFFDGCYIEPPYVVERRGLEYFINGRLIKTVRLLPQRRIYKSSDEPPSVTNVEATSGFADIGAQIFKLYNYLLDVYPEEAARAKIRSCLTNLACVLSLEDHPMGVPNTYLIHFRNGECRSVYFKYKWEDDDERHSDEDIVRVMNKLFGFIRNEFHHGVAWFDFSHGAPFQIHGEKVLSDLGLLCDVLASSRTTDEKRDIIRRMDIKPYTHHEEMGMLISNFCFSANCLSRLKTLQEQKNVIPRKINDVPAVAPADVREQMSR
jgi:hypothetical protein